MHHCAILSVVSFQNYYSVVIYLARVNTINSKCCNDMDDFFNLAGFLSHRSTMGSDISYLLSTATTMLFVASGIMAKKKSGLAHHYMVLVSALVMLGYFLFYYQVRKLGLISFTDQLGFHGPEWVYLKIFRPALMAHFLTVALSVYLAIYMILNGFSSVLRKGNKIELCDGSAKSSPALWLLGAFWLMLLVYFTFFTHNFSSFHKVLFLFLGYGLPAGLTIAINLTFRRKEQRHRMIGKLCLVFFVLLFITNTLVYYLLYMSQW